MQAASSGELLTQLCAICHVNTPKYTCPRCAIHTCSLACVKKHKTWAQCSGVRDPAAYRKRYELATESSVDQDFNFITKVERTLERADDNLSNRGIHLHPINRFARFGTETASKLDQEVEARGIILKRAPRGLDRSKSNKSHWSGQHGYIVWTVEWIFESGEKRRVNTPESKTVADACIAAFGKREIKLKRKREIQHDGDEPSVKALAKPDEEPLSEDFNLAPAQEQASNSALESEQLAKVDSKAAAVISPEESIVNNPKESTEIDSTPGEKKQRPSDILEGLHFYLHCPDTPFKYKVLHGISSDSTFKDLLQGQTIIEFPTIYMLSKSSDELHEPFMSLPTYQTKHSHEHVVDFVAQDPLEAHVESTEPHSSIDSVQVLEVLQKDLAG